MSGSTRSTVQSTLVIILVTSVSKVLGLVRESALAAYFGASSQTDAYKTAFDIPALVVSLVLTVIGITFIPVYTKYRKVKSEEDCRHFVSNAFNVVFLIAVLLTFAGMLLSPVLVKTVAPGLKGDTYSLALRLTMIMCPSLLFMALNGLAGGFLQVNYRFVSTAFAGIPYNILIISSILFFYRWGIEAVAIGTLLAYASQVALQFPSMLKAGYRFKPVLNFKEEGLHEMVLLAMPILLSSLFSQIYTVVERVLASNLREGSISALDYAGKVNNLVYSVFIMSVVTVIYPNLSFFSDDAQKFGQAVTKGLKAAIFVAFPMAAGLIALRTPIIKVLFERGAFDGQDTQLTSIVLGCFALGIVGIGTREILYTAFYSMKDTRTIMVNQIATTCVNITLSLLLVGTWGGGGLAISASISATISSGMLLLQFLKNNRKLCLAEMGAAFVKSAAAAAVMGILLWTLKSTILDDMPDGMHFAVKAARIIVVAGAGSVIYCIVLYVLRVEELSLVKNIIKAKLASGLRMVEGAKNLNAENVHEINRRAGGEASGMDIYVVIIMSDETGVFWPLTRENAPRPFLHTLIVNESVKMLKTMVEASRIFLVANQKYDEIIHELITDELPENNILFEPVERSTCASAAYTAMHIKARAGNAVICVLPSGFCFHGDADLKRILNEVCELARDTGKLITVGLEPTYPTAGYGCIKYNRSSIHNNKAYEVTGFIEKPGMDRVKKYAESGSILWNSRIYAWTVSAVQDGLKRYMPRFHKIMEEMGTSINTQGEQEAAERAYSEIENISIESGILERSDEVLVVPGHFGWKDVRDWDILGSVFPADENGNIIRAEHVGIGTTNSIIYGSNRLIATVGLESLIIVDTGETLLICPKERSQEVKSLVVTLKDRGLEEYL